MAVFRVEKNKGYTIMSNHHLRNKELTLKAKGLLSQMLSFTLFIAINLIVEGNSRSKLCLLVLILLVA